MTRQVFSRRRFHVGHSYGGQTAGLQSIGHFGYFRPPSEKVWREAVQWLEATVAPG